MTPIYQNRYGKERGNCFQAAAATLFNLELEQVPDFCNKCGDDWHEQFVLWLNQWGLSCVTVGCTDTTLNGYYFRGCTLLVTVKNKDGVNHSVLYKNGKMIHDPNFWYNGNYTVEAVDLIFPITPTIVNDTQTGE